VLAPIWTRKPETASRLRGKIEQILDAAKALGLRTADNPAVWRGHLKLWLQKRVRSEDRHHAALSYERILDLMRGLRQQPGVAPLALRFTILTAARSGEVLGAQWVEIDIEESVWTVPANRMKGKRKHRVPLSDRALEVLAEAGGFKTSNLVFPGRKPHSPLSSMALEMVLRRMKFADVTVHGMRSSFRDWAGNETHFARELAEHALAHRIGDKSERAYWRADALKRRLGNSPRTVLEELARIQSHDVVLPTATRGEIRLRCVAQPDAAQAALLDRLGIVLPKRMRPPENQIPAVALTT